MENTLIASPDVVHRIKQILVEDLQLRLVPDLIPDDCSLLQSGLALDSILIAELIAQIESRFGLQLDDRVLDPTLFEKLSTLAAFVASEQIAALANVKDATGGSPC
jgi:acyl carrier protein